MATIVLNHLSIQPQCPVIYRNGVELKPRSKWTLDGYKPDGFDTIGQQREGKREIKDVLLLHFREKPSDDNDPFLIRNWDHHTTPDELFRFFGENINRLNGSIYIDDVDPWMCFTEDNDFVLYFGKDKPKLKTKKSKILTVHAKIWGNHSKWYKEGKEPVEYKYWDVKDKSKLLFCGVSTIERVFPEFDWANIDPYGKSIKRIDLGVFRCSDQY